MNKIKVFFFLFILISMSTPLFSQKFEGTFSAHNQIWSGELVLMKTSHFKMNSSLNMGHVTTHSKGYYLKASDTLILFFEKYDDPSPSTFNVKKLSSTRAMEGKHQTISTIQFQNKSGKSLAGVLATFRTRSNTDFITLMSNNDGMIANIVFLVGEVDEIRFQMLGYKEIILKTSSLESDLLSIDVILQASEAIEYDNKPRIGKYLITSNKATIELHGIDSSKEIIYILKK